jgi:hypothetical protein
MNKDSEAALVGSDKSLVFYVLILSAFCVLAAITAITTSDP